ncbi:MAG: ROK family protein [Bacteroidales bacterium]|nr:ROK family protein [Bacteroidales bacterium]
MGILGIDIGGSGIKGAPVNIENGTFLQERYRVDTPSISTPENMAVALQELVDNFAWKGKIGIGFPAIVRDGVAKTAANIDKSWQGKNIVDLFSKSTGLSVAALNDADAAGLAELRFGNTYNNENVVLFLTVGTGIGTAIFHKGRLLPNMELGHIELKGKDAEQYCSDAVRRRQNLTRTEWAARFNDYLVHVEKLVSPDLIILGGGSSKKFHKFKNEFTIKTKIVPASLLNNAGIIGGAMHAHESLV